jgi:hypothetical protein
MRIDAFGLICDQRATGNIPGDLDHCLYCDRPVFVPEIGAALPHLSGRPVLPMGPGCATTYFPDAVAHVQGIRADGSPAGYGHLQVPALSTFLDSIRHPPLDEYLGRLRDQE